MRIAHVTPWDPKTTIGGQERMINDLVAGLRGAKRADVDVFSLDAAETAKFVRFGKIPALMLLSAKKWDFRDYDLVHLHGWVSEIFLGRRTAAPKLVSMYGTIAQYMENVKLNPFFAGYNRLTQLRFEQRACRDASYLTALAKKQKHEMIEHYNCPLEKVRAINCGINLRLFSPKGKEESRERLGLPADAKIALACGRMSIYHKGFDVLLKLAEAAGNNATIVVNGTVPDNLKKMMPKNMIATTTKLQDMPYLYSGADVLVHPSRYEGFGLVVAEAMACGTPAVAFDTGAAAELIGKGEAGRLVPDVHDDNGFVDAAMELLAGDDLADAAGRAAIKRASGYGVDAMVDGFYGYYSEIIQPG